MKKETWKLSIASLIVYAVTTLLRIAYSFTFSLRALTMSTNVRLLIMSAWSILSVMMMLAVFALALIGTILARKNVKQNYGINWYDNAALGISGSLLLITAISLCNSVLSYANSIFLPIIMK